MNELVIYDAGDGRPLVSARIEGETVWLTHRQMSGLFENTPENVLMHLKNIYADNELGESATAKDFLAVQTEGQRQVQCNLRHYNRNAIISAGSRINPQGAVRFRQCATGVLNVDA